MKLIRFVSGLILVVALLSVYSYFVVLAVQDNGRPGTWKKPLLAYSTFVKTVYNVFTSAELKRIPPSYMDKDKAFEEINYLDYNLYALNAFFNYQETQWDIKLFNLRNDSLVFEWHLDESNFFNLNDAKKFDRSPPRNSIMLKDRSLLVDLDGSFNLLRINENSDVIWHNTDKMFHHSMNLDADSTLWIGTKASSAFTDFETGALSYFDDDFITRVDIETGKIIFDKSITEIFVENHLEGLIYGQANSVSEGTDNFDPIHLNDIEPVLADGPHWKKGDLFVSLRNRSLLFLYRPQTNEVIDIISGPFIHQHDVDIISDHEISLFNNNVSRLGSADSSKFKFQIYFEYPFKNSEIVIYNFEDKQFRWHLEKQLENEQIVTFTEGRHDILKSGDTFIESQNSGKLYLLNEDKIIFRKYLKTEKDGKIEQPNWMRIYETIE